MVITKEHLFQWNIEQVLTKIKNEYSLDKTKEYALDVRDNFEDWLNSNPEILGRYMCEQLNSNFDFEQFKNR